jgi:hypothetical protein
MEATDFTNKGHPQGKRCEWDCGEPRGRELDTKVPSLREG